MAVIHSSLLFVTLLLLNLVGIGLALPQGPGSGPSGLPPPNPSATVSYQGNGSAYISAEGDYQAVLTQCRGLDGTRALTYVNVFTKYPDGRAAYKLRLFPEWGCEGTPLTEVSFYYNENAPLTDANGNVIIPKSVRFVPA